MNMLLCKKGVSHYIDYVRHEYPHVMDLTSINIAACNVTRLRNARHKQCGQAGLMSTNRSVQATGGKARPRQAVENECMKVMDNVGRPHVTSPNQCVQYIDNAGRPHLTLVERCVQATKDRCNPHPTLASCYVKDKGDAGRPYQTSSCHSMQDKGESGRPHPRRLTIMFKAKRSWKDTSNIDRPMCVGYGG